MSAIMDQMVGHGARIQPPSARGDRLGRFGAALLA